MCTEGILFSRIFSGLIGIRLNFLGELSRCVRIFGILWHFNFQFRISRVFEDLQGFLFFTCGITFESMDVVLSFFLKAIFEDLKSFMRIHCKLKLEFQGSLSIFPTWIYFSLIFEFLGGSFDCIVLQPVFKIHIGIFLGLDCHWNISSKRFS